MRIPEDSCATNHIPKPYHKDMSIVKNGIAIALLIHLPLSSCAQQANEQQTPNFSTSLLQSIQSMPVHGGYDGSDATKNLLAKASSHRNGSFHITPEIAKPSFCSGATYLVLLKALRTGSDDLLPKIDQQDGHGIFGRWNANGPGAAKLIADLNAGKNFTDWNSAQPGDIMKIWWTDEIGKYERGHLVIYLGHTEDKLTFWSSNQPNGYGKKTIPRKKCKRVLFTRITQPQKLRSAGSLPPVDPWLANMLSKQFTWNEVVKNCKVIQ